MDFLRDLLNKNSISPLNYYFAQFIAQNSNQSMNSLLCKTAAFLSYRQQQGDTCINLAEYANQQVWQDDSSSYCHKFTFPNLDEWKKGLKASGCVSIGEELQPMRMDDNLLFLSRFYKHEYFISQNLLKRTEKANYSIFDDSLMQILDKLFPSNSIELDQQKLAAVISVIHNFSVISGGPGTGKTTTLIKLICLLIAQQQDISIKLCAPTGKASKRMIEAISQSKEGVQVEENIKQKIPNSSSTLHRLLGYQRGQFEYNEHNKLIIDCLIIDEASMVDIELFSAVLKALPEECKLILLGDRDQLSSVDAGHVFNDICGQGSEIIYSETVREAYSEILNFNLEFNNKESNTPISNSIALLSKSYRFDQTSHLALLANAVNSANLNQIDILFEQKNDDLKFFNPLENQLTDAAKSFIYKQYEEVIKADNATYAINLLSQFQVLSSVKKGYFGVKYLNQMINEYFYQKGLIQNAEIFNGLPIIITKNNHELSLYNGDVGIVWEIKGQYYAFFKQSDHSLKQVALTNLIHYEAAWVITVHKSQGSEYQSVMLLLPPHAQNKHQNHRELVYTAITRAKKQFYYCGKIEDLKTASLNKTQRSTQLSQKLLWKQKSK